MQIQNHVYPFLRIVGKNKNAVNNDNLKANRYPNLSPLVRDTVSFTASEKLNRSLLEAFDNRETCAFVYENADVPSEYLKKALRESLTLYMVSEKNPDAPIQRISTRVKSPDSIREKAAGKLGSAIKSKKVFDPENPEDIKRVCSDIIGARVILRQSDSNKTKEIIDALIKEVKAGKLNITKIENYKPSDLPEKWEYFKIEDLQRLCKAVNEMRVGLPPIEVSQRSKETGYMALHLDVDLSNPEFKAKNNGYKGEIQIVGYDVANLKEVEDFCYKLKDNKDIKSGHVAYKPFSDYFVKLLRSNPKIEDRFIEYTLKAYLYQRKKEPVDNSHRKKKDNKLPTLQECGMEGKLPKGLDFNILSSIKYYCDKIYDLTSKI